MYSHYYKYGFEHFINKNLLGLKKPDTKKQVFYLIMIFGVILTGIMI